MYDFKSKFRQLAERVKQSGDADDVRVITYLDNVLIPHMERMENLLTTINDLSLEVQGDVESDIEEFNLLDVVDTSSVTIIT